MIKTQDKPASFISKLYCILRSKEHSKAITWDSELKGIRIVNQKKLQQFVLPRYYRHNRVSSFVRQLNMYDFHKIHLGDHKSIFCHAEFNPKNKESLYTVKRKIIFNQEQGAIQEEKEDGEQQQQQLKKTNVSQQKLKDKEKPKKDSTKINDQQNRDQKQLNNKYSIKSLKEFSKMDKQNIWNKKSSFRFVKDSIRSLEQDKQKDNDTQKQQHILNEIIQKLTPLKIPNAEQLGLKLQQLVFYRKYHKFIKNKEFKKQIYSKFGFKFDENKQQEGDELSQLSIQENLLISSSRRSSSFTLKSLRSSMRMFESGSLNLNKKDTIGFFMSL